MILDGRKIRDERKEALIDFVQTTESKPTLVIVQVGKNDASVTYIEQKKKFGESIGARVVHECFPETVSYEELGKVIGEHNQDVQIHGIIVQLPLPQHLNSQQVIDCINPRKDVDGLTTENKQKLEERLPRFVPATARGIATLLEAYNIPVENKKITIIGRSALVGRPTAQIMEARGAIVVVCHRETQNIPEKTREADIVIVATGHPKLVTKEYVRAGQTVIDVGINTLSGESFDEEVPGKKYVGDVDFEAVESIVEHISPVPGGVGPMTVLSLFENLLDAYKAQGV